MPPDRFLFATEDGYPASKLYQRDLQLQPVASGIFYPTSYEVVMSKFILPNVFTPNNDGINDYFEIPNLLLE